MKKAKLLLIGGLISFFLNSCSKDMSQENLQRIYDLAKKYNFSIGPNSKYNTKNFQNISDLEREMSAIYSQNKLGIISNVDSVKPSDTIFINNKIKQLKSSIVTNSNKIKSFSTDYFDDPVFKYSKTFYFNNPGIVPNYAVTVQYNAAAGSFTSANVSVSTYGSIYATGKLLYLNPPVLFFSNGSLAFQAQTSMTYSFNFPGMQYLGLSSTSLTQFNGWLQLDENNNISSGAGSQSPYDADSKYQKQLLYE